MADIGGQQGRNHRPYGHPPNPRRDAAFSEIFGGAPPGRSQTMTSQTPQLSQDRAHTMSSQVSRPQMQRVPPPPTRQLQNGYPQHQPSQPNQPNQTNQPNQPNAYYQAYPGSATMSSQTSQGAPRPYPGRFAYPQPQRLDSRPAAGPPFQDPNGYNRAVPHPALNSDAYRSRSMARVGAPPVYQPPPNSFNHTSATAFRQQPYNPATPMTAQGRVVPERHGNERTMSLTSYSVDRESAHTTTRTGRVIPNRRQPSGPIQAPIVQEEVSPVNPDYVNGRTRPPSDGSAHPPRTFSMASTALPDRTFSMASTALPDRTLSMQSTMTHVPSPQIPGTLGLNQVRQSKQLLTVNPALLSRVADAFREHITLSERQKNGLSYQNAFSGADAVDAIGGIIKTTDRNLSLLLGRALDAQKLFHDVTYDHRLRDAPGEIYQFKETMGEEAPSSDVNGVFTLLTECYSPTCNRDSLCYSIACPRRLEQQARLNMKPLPGLRTSASKSSLHGDDDGGDDQKLWINMVPKEVSDNVDDKEKKRQEIIFEIMYTERDFVKDLEYLRDFWMRPLRSNNSPIPEHRREKFIRTVFGNCLDVLKVNGALSEALNVRQKESHVVRTVGDIFLQHVPRFDPFIKYGANQLYGRYEFEKEKTSNPAFAKFVEETERLKESRKLELNGYLTKPTTRLARYPLLLEQVGKNTAEGNADKDDIPNAVKIIKDFLSRVNAESGRAENHFNLVNLNTALKFTPTDYVDLKLTEENRQMLTKMAFKKTPTDTSEVTVYLFDHAVLLVRIKVVNKREEYRVYRKPIPLELLVIPQMDEVIPKPGIAKRPSSGLLANRAAANPPAAKDTLPITFRHLGKGGYEQTLYASSSQQRKKFLELVDEQQTKLRERNSNFYNKNIICGNFFNAINRVNCLVPIDGGRKLVYGTDNGIYVSDRIPKDPKERSVKPKRVLDASQVTQIDTLEQYQLLLVLQNKTLTSYPLEALEVTESQNSLAKRPKKIQGHANFFKSGIGLGRHLVCSVKTSALSTTIKVYEPMDNLAKGKKKSTVSKMFQSGQDTLKPFKEYYIPAESSSIHYLRSTLCVGCARGFEVVSLETTETQSLLDQADTSLDFVARKENVKPIHIERMNGEFLLNYSDFSFFVNRNGWRARPDWKISWEGNPIAFALSYPYILAFESNFIEFRHIETSELIHIMTGKNIRMLHSSTREILYAYEDDTGEDVVASLDFWKNKPSQQQI